LGNTAEVLVDFCLRERLGLGVFGPAMSHQGLTNALQLHVNLDCVRELVEALAFVRSYRVCSPWAPK
jgi:hypothetical protein